MNERIDALRELIYEGIRKALEIDLRYKSYEGELEVTVLYPNYFEWIYGQGAPVYVIRLDSCVLGPSRHYEWTGDTLDEAIDKAMSDVTEWVKEAEFEAYAAAEEEDYREYIADLEFWRSGAW